MPWFSKKKSDQVSPLFERVHRLLSDESLQNQMLPEGLKHEILWSDSVDVVPGAWGEFARDLNNPIPTNGPLGEILYLSSLKLEDGRPIAFQRLGSVDKVDVFEVVTFDGGWWDLLHLTMYFPRKSKVAPTGYRFFGEERGQFWIRGVNDFAPEFPAGILRRTVEYTERRFGWSIADPGLKSLDSVPWERSARHKSVLDQLQFSGQLRR